MVLANFVAIALVLLSTNFVKAVDLSDEQKTTISQTCINAQSNLQRISSGDTTTRINRGRNYDQILKLFYLMNTRVASNNIAEPKLAEITKSFESELANFRENYNIYNTQLKNTTEYKCSANPQEFYNHLENTREKRLILNDDTVKLNNLIEDYKVVVRELVK